MSAYIPTAEEVELMTSSDLVKSYNGLAFAAGVKQVKKFETRAVGIKRLTDVVAALRHCVADAGVQRCPEAGGDVTDILVGGLPETLVSDVEILVPATGDEPTLVLNVPTDEEHIAYLERQATPLPSLENEIPEDFDVAPKKLAKRKLSKETAKKQIARTKAKALEILANLEEQGIKAKIVKSGQLKAVVKIVDPRFGGPKKPKDPTAETVVDACRRMVREGLTNAEIWKSIQSKYKLPDEKKNYPAAIRGDMRRGFADMGKGS